MQRGLPSAGAERLETSFERGDAALEHSCGRVTNAAITVSLDLEIEQSGPVLGAVERIRNCLIDWDGYSFRCGINFIPSVDCNRFIPHPTPPPTAVIAVPKRGPACKGLYAASAGRRRSTTLKHTRTEAVKEKSPSALRS